MNYLLTDLPLFNTQYTFSLWITWIKMSFTEDSPMRKWPDKKPKHFVSTLICWCGGKTQKMNRENSNMTCAFNNIAHHNGLWVTIHAQNQRLHCITERRQIVWWWRRTIPLMTLPIVWCRRCPLYWMGTWWAFA